MTVAVVTGGAGFIGSHLVDALLEENISVRVVDNYSTGRPENLSHVSGKVDLVEADFSKPGVWQKSFQGADWVFTSAPLPTLCRAFNTLKNIFRPMSSEHLMF